MACVRVEQLLESVGMHGPPADGAGSARQPGSQAGRGTPSLVSTRLTLRSRDTALPLQTRPHREAQPPAHVGRGSAGGGG